MLPDFTITPALVLSAYRATGMRPIRGAWGSDSCGCPLVAILACLGGPPTEYGLFERAACDYVVGFVVGVDGDPNLEATTPESIRGYADGRLAWAAVRAAGLVKA